jgi:hypothetical protein
MLSLHPYRCRSVFAAGVFLVGCLGVFLINGRVPRHGNSSSVESRDRNVGVGSVEVASPPLSSAETGRHKVSRPWALPSSTPPTLAAAVLIWVLALPSTLRATRT